MPEPKSAYLLWGVTIDHPVGPADPPAAHPVRMLSATAAAWRGFIDIQLSRQPRDRQMGTFAHAHSMMIAVRAGTALNPSDACAIGISTHGTLFDFQNRNRGSQGLCLIFDFLLNEDSGSVRKVHLFDPIFVSVHISYDGIVGTNYLENWRTAAVCFLDQMLGFRDDTSRTDLESTSNKTEAAILHSREGDIQKPILPFVQIGESLSSEYPLRVLAHLNYHRKSFGLKIISLNQQSALKITRL
jgi:hypothetical protein